MAKLIAVFIFVLFLTVAGAGEPTLDIDPDPELGSIAVSVTVKYRKMTTFDWWPAVRMYFVKLGNEGDVYASDEVIESNWFDSKQVFLLNVEPGRYVAVAAAIKGREFSNTLTISGGAATSSVQPGGRYEYIAFLPESVIPQTEVVVLPGKIAFMGKIKAKPDSVPPDRAQAHFLELVLPDVAMEQVEEVASLIIKNVERSSKTEASFWDKAETKTLRTNLQWSQLVGAQQRSQGDE